MTNHVAGGLFTKQQRESVDEDGFAGAGFAGQQVEPRAKGDGDAQILWHILAGAVRGPDVCDSAKLKLQTTVPLRRAAFPLTAKASHHGATRGVGALFNSVDEYVTISAQPHNSHFNAHVIQAGLALGVPVYFTKDFENQLHEVEKQLYATTSRLARAKRAPKRKS